MNVGMHVRGYMAAVFVSAVLFFGCRGKNCGVREDYSFVEDCLNGCSIVSDGRNFGVTDESGRVVVPVQYGRLFFLADDLIAGFFGDGGHSAAAGLDSGRVAGVDCGHSAGAGPDGGHLACAGGEAVSGWWHFLDTHGNVLGETAGSPEDEPETLFAGFRSIRMEQERVWEEIVSGYELFCGRCAFEGAVFGDMKTVADSLREEIRRAEGQMSVGQRRRIVQAYGKYLEDRAL